MYRHYHPLPQEGERFFFSREQVIQMNLKFAAAMLAARKAGLEKFTTGPKKDNTPFVPTPFFRALKQSMSGSSAALLADEVGLMEFHRPAGGRAGRG
jgi:hypothetical protein